MYLVSTDFLFVWGGFFNSFLPHLLMVSKTRVFYLQTDTCVKNNNVSAIKNSRREEKTRSYK